MPHQHAPRLRRASPWRPVHPGHGDDASRRKSAAHAILDAGDRGDARGNVESLVGPLGLAPRHPERFGDMRDLIEQLHRRYTGADDDHPLAGELLGRDVVRDVQLAAAEAALPGVVRPEWAGPGAGRVDDVPSSPRAAIGFDEKSLLRPAEGGDTHRAAHVEGELSPRRR